MELPEFTLSESALLTDNLRQIVSDETPRNMEAYNQGFGCIVYKTTLPAGGAATLQFDRINDFAVVLLDNTPLTTIDRRLGETSCQLPARNAETKLTLVVEAMGRVNSDSWLPDRKGILGEVLLKDAEGTRSPAELERLPGRTRQRKSAAADQLHLLPEAAGTRFLPGTIRSRSVQRHLPRHEQLGQKDWCGSTATASAATGISARHKRCTSPDRGSERARTKSSSSTCSRPETPPYTAARHPFSTG